MSKPDPKTDVYGAVPTPIPSSAEPEPTTEIEVGSIDVLGLLGTEIHGGFLVEELVSSDGLSIVYRAENPQSGSRAALKCFFGLRDLSPDSLSSFRDRFRRITSLLGALSNDQASMTRVLGQGWMAVGDKEIPCMLVDWVDGVPMESILDVERRAGGQRRSAAEVFTLMRAPMKALAAAHAYGLTHRNIKPANFLVEGDALAPGVGIRITDYALARLEGEPFEDAITFLTPEYAAPEQFMGYEHLVGPWTDVFSMALVLIEMMLGGHQVMPGDDFESLRDACLNEEKRPTPRTFGLEVSDEVELVFHRALEIDVHRRYNSGAHFKGALSRALENSTVTNARGLFRAAGEFQHSESDYITRSEKAPTTPRRTTERVTPKPEGDTQVSAIPPVAQRPPMPAIITGETVVAPQPVRTGNTVLAPLPQFDDS
ncbi:MAG: protein kinase [Myxococcota bacterium]